MRILIVKTSALGDIIHAFPTLDYLRKRFPDAVIDWVVEAPYAELLQAHPDIDHVITVDTKAWRRALLAPVTWQKIGYSKALLQQQPYDLVIDLQGNVKSGIITFLTKSSIKIGFGKSSAPEQINCLCTTHRYDPPSGRNIREDYLSLVHQHFHDTTPFTSSPVQLKASLSQLPPLPSGRTVMVCPGSAWKNKQLLPETLQRLLERMNASSSCSFVFVWGNDHERAWCESLHRHFLKNSLILDRQPLPQLQAIMSKMDLVIAVDSLPLHLAGTTGVPTYSIFGPSLAVKYAPMGVQHHTFQGDCPYGRTFEKRCPILRTCPTGACMHDIPSDKLG